MAGSDGRRARRLGIGEKLERPGALRALDLAIERAAQAQQAVHETPLRRLQLVPGLLVAGLAKVWNDTRETARKAQRIRIVRRHRPIAYVVLDVVLAQPILPPRGVWQRRGPQV